MADHEMKQHDVLPVITATLNRGSLPEDLTGCSVRFIMRVKNGSTPKVAAAAEIVGDPTLGNVRYVWLSSDTDTAGTFDAEWEVTTPQGKQTFPTEGYITVTIFGDLDNA